MLVPSKFVFKKNISTVSSFIFYCIVVSSAHTVTPSLLEQGFSSIDVYTYFSSNCVPLTKFDFSLTGQRKLFMFARFSVETSSRIVSFSSS